MDIEEARAALEADRQVRLEACMAEIREVLDRYGMTLDVMQPPAQLCLREVQQ